MKYVKLFEEDYNNMINLSFVSYDAGMITREGIIAFNEIGAETTFSVGMPIYSAKTGEYIGRLSAGSYDHLNTVWHDALGNQIPVTKWFVEGYNGKRQCIKTYWQIVTERQKGEDKRFKENNT